MVIYSIKSEMVQSESVLLIQSNDILYAAFYTRGLCFFLLQILGQFITNSFNAVHEKKMTSIAFPPIGTGDLQIPLRFFANVLIDELLKFSLQNPKTTLADVRLILHFTDHMAIQASKHTSMFRMS